MVGGRRVIWCTISTTYALSFTILALCWTIGVYAAPHTHQPFARLTISGAHDELKLAGAAFACVWDHDLRGQRCQTELDGSPLSLTVSSSHCSASFRRDAKSCQRGGEVVGEYRVEGAAWRGEPPVSLWLLHRLGTMGECDWGDIAMYSALLSTLLLMHGLSYCGERLRRRLLLRALIALPTLPMVFLSLFFALVRMGYAD